MSSGAGMLTQRSQSGVVPHLLGRSNVAAQSGETTRCPRCNKVVCLPPSAKDGDLTECHGLLLRITCDDLGCQLERL